MKTQKLVHYEVAVSPRFPSTHKRKGEPTFFIEKIQLALNMLVQLPGDLLIDLDPKLHTCRKNYPLWVKRMKNVNEGRAVIDLYYWKLKGGRFTEGNKKVVFATLDHTSGCGVQELSFYLTYDGEALTETVSKPFVFSKEANGIPPVIPLDILATNDGLSPTDFKEWFKTYDEPLAIIQFTKFRY